MEIKCKCGDVVVKGNVRHKEKKKGGQKKTFEIDDKINGEIRKNNSSDPQKWTGICPRCQKENAQNEKIANKIAVKL
jgi:hypothetical protein